MTRRTFQRVTVVVIGAAMGVAAPVAARAWAHGPGGMHAGMMKRMISAALDEALDQAAVTGLGLTLARRVAEVHGGAIAIGPGAGGHGCRVTLAIPRVAVTSSA